MAARERGRERGDCSNRAARDVHWFSAAAAVAVAVLLRKGYRSPRGLSGQARGLGVRGTGLWVGFGKGVARV